MYKHCGGVGPGRPADSSAAIQADLLWLLSLQARDGLQLRGRGACVLLRSSSDRLPHPVNFDGELDRVDRRLRAEVVHAGLQAELPAVEVHGGQLRRGGVHHVDVQGLRLVDVDAAICRHVDDHPLLDLPHSLVELLQVAWQINVLDAAIVRDQLHAHLLRVELPVDEIPEKVTVDGDELAGQDAAHIEVLRVRLERLVVAKDLRSAGCGHRCHQKGVPEAMLRDLCLETGPIPTATARRVPPEVELQLPLAGRRARVRLVRPINLGELARRLASCEVYRLEDVDVQLLCRRALERHPHEHEGVREALHAQPDGAVPHVGVLCLDDRIVVAVDDPVQILGDNLRHPVQLLEVVRRAILGHEGRKGQGREIAHGDLIGRRVLDDLRA
mmetsp:Transcript_72697/g.210465  ORF Transcript_72697/g.210465 Transcript_72697/m.210465 type:complete len:386 (+) Transcript_72697:277-1434(+)